MTTAALSGDQPHFVPASVLPQVLADAGARGVRVGRIALGAATDPVGVFDQLRTVLTFPDFCGSGWDSFDDASAEIAAESTFPLLLVVDGIVELLTREPHFALHTMLNLTDEARRWSTDGLPWTIVVPVEGPVEPPRRRLAPRGTPADPTPFAGVIPPGGQPFVIARGNAAAVRRGTIPAELDLAQLRSGADVDAAVDAIEAAPPADGVIIAAELSELLRRDPLLALQAVLALDLSFANGYLVFYPG